jgi:hypothetical protein
MLTSLSTLSAATQTASQGGVLTSLRARLHSLKYHLQVLGAHILELVELAGQSANVPPLHGQRCATAVSGCQAEPGVRARLYHLEELLGLQLDLSVQFEAPALRAEWPQLQPSRLASSWALKCADHGSRGADSAVCRSRRSNTPAGTAAAEERRDMQRAAYVARMQRQHQQAEQLVQGLQATLAGVAAALQVPLDSAEVRATGLVRGRTQPLRTGTPLLWLYLSVLAASHVYGRSPEARKTSHAGCACWPQVQAVHAAFIASSQRVGWTTRQHGAWLDEEAGRQLGAWLQYECGLVLPGGHSQCGPWRLAAVLAGSKPSQGMNKQG